VNLVLSRDDAESYGVFGSVQTEDGTPVCVTLEHAFQQDDGTYKPIIPVGTHQCVRGTHCLHNGVPFETFEVMGVEGHTGLLFHPGNFNRDSEGCVLVGTSRSGQMIQNSIAAFRSFLDLQDGVDEFTLIVR
jgi:hypothetical protein